MQSGAHHVLSALALLLGLAAVGCKSEPPPEPTRAHIEIEDTSGVTDPETLAGDLRAFSSVFVSTVAGLGSTIAAETQDRVVRERSLQWRLQVIPAVRLAAAEHDPRFALANLWAVSARQRYMLEREPEHPLMGDQNERVLAAARELEAQVVAIARRHLAPDKVELATARIEEVARSQSVVQMFQIQVKSEKSEDGSPIHTLIGLPLGAISGIGGIGDTPQELHYLGLVAESFRELFRAMPDIVRWQIELLTLSLEDLPTVKSLRDLARTATELPDKLGREIRTTIEGAQPGLDSVRATAEHVEATVKASTELLHAYQAAFPPAPEAPPDAKPVEEPKGEPFAMTDVTAAAQQLTVTIHELRALLDDLHTASTTGTVPALEKTAQSTLRQASDSAGELVDRIFLRALILLVALVGLLALLRLVPRRVRASRTPTRA